MENVPVITLLWWYSSISNFREERFTLVHNFRETSVRWGGKAWQGPGNGQHGVGVCGHGEDNKGPPEGLLCCQTGSQRLQKRCHNLGSQSTEHEPVWILSCSNQNKDCPPWMLQSLGPIHESKSTLLYLDFEPNSTTYLYIAEASVWFSALDSQCLFESPLSYWTNTMASPRCVSIWILLGEFLQYGISYSSLPLI